MAGGENPIEPGHVGSWPGDELDKARYQARLDFLSENMREDMRKDLEEVIAGEPEEAPSSEP